MFQILKSFLKNKKFPVSNKIAAAKTEEILNGLFGEDFVKGNVKITFSPPKLFIKTNNSLLKNEIILNQQEILIKIKEFYKGGEINKIV